LEAAITKQDINLNNSSGGNNLLMAWPDFNCKFSREEREKCC